MSMLKGEVESLSGNGAGVSWGWMEGPEEGKSDRGGFGGVPLRGGVHGV